MRVRHMLPWHLFAFITSFTILCVAAAAQDVALIQDRAWLLDGLHVRPADDPRAVEAEQQAGRTHPVGKTFLELRKDGTFTLLRGDEVQQQGKWTLTGSRLELQRLNPAGELIGAPLAYEVITTDANRLTLKVVLPPALPEVRLDFSPSRMPR